MSNQRRFVLLLCAFLCSAKTWNMDGEDRNTSERLVAFIEKKRNDAADNVNRTGLSTAAWALGYGDVQKEDLQLLIDFVPAKKEEIRVAVIHEWTPDETLSQERRQAWQGKNLATVVTDLKESKVARLKALTGKELSKNDMYATMRNDLAKEEARKMIIQDLADLRMFEEEMQQSSAWGRFSGLLKSK
jgi:hypothetical protein